MSRILTTILVSCLIHTISLCSHESMRILACFSPTNVYIYIGLMELGGRLIECLPSFYLKCRNLWFLPMDSWAAFSLGGFVAGWLARDWSLKAPEIPICRCECNVGSSPVVTDQSLVSGNSLLILLAVIGLVIALSNTALAFKVTYRDSETGQGREFAFDVKGKSKGQLGVFGSSKGLQITNW